MRELYNAVIGKNNKNYYLAKFESFDKQGVGLKPSWNWSALFATGGWALYRKMYGWFFVWWGVLSLSSILEKSGSSVVSGLIVLVSLIVFSTYADSIYHNKVKTKIAVGQLTFRDDSSLLEYLNRKGGVHKWVVWVFGAISIIGVVAAIVLPIIVESKNGNSFPSGFLLGGVVVGFIYWMWRATKPKSAPNISTEARGAGYSKIRPDAEAVWAQASEEFNTNRNEGLWAKCFAECDGDENKAKARYLREKVDAILGAQAYRVAGEGSPVHVPIKSGNSSGDEGGTRNSKNANATVVKDSFKSVLAEEFPPTSDDIERLTRISILRVDKEFYEAQVALAIESGRRGGWSTTAIERAAKYKGELENVKRELSFLGAPVH